MKINLIKAVVCSWYVVSMLGLPIFLPAYGQSKANTKAYIITYRQIFRFNNLPDTSIGILNATSTASAYTYGIKPASEQKEVHYTSADGQNHQILVSASTGDSIGKSIFKHYNDRLMISREKAVNQYFVVQDTLGHINWKIGGEQLTIDHHQATNATGSFHGRNYTVWFTEAIKLPDGPWKLAGLPGLILKAKDDSGEVGFEAIQIQENANVSLSITPPSGFPQILTYEAFRHKEQELEAQDMEKGRAYFPKSGNVKKVSVSFKINKLEY
jgi:GLPGLI family protein